jgi:hypothetical protein
MPKEGYATAMGGGRTRTARARRPWATIPIAERRRLNFRNCFASGAAAWAEDFAEPLEVADRCQARGLDGLLAAPDCA